MINFTAITVARPICLVVLSVGMQACVIPIPFPSAEIVIIEKELIESIRIGQTSKVDLQHNLGPPDWSLNDGSRWMYYTRTYRPAGLGLLVDGVGSVPLIDWRTEFLYLTFNGSDVIDNREISLAEPDPGAGWSKREVKSESEVNSNICIDGYNKPLAYGSADDDKYAKRFRAEPNSCAAYLYTSTRASPFFVKTRRTGCMLQVLS